MSWQAFVWTSSEEVIKADISPGAHHVLTVMSKFADEWGRGCFPGVPKISEISHQSIRTVQRGLRELESKKLIIVAQDQSPAAVKRPVGKRATVYNLAYSRKYTAWVKADLAEREGGPKPKGTRKSHLRAV